MPRSEVENNWQMPASKEENIDKCWVEEKNVFVCTDVETVIKTLFSLVWLQVWHDAPGDLHRSLYEHFFELLTDSRCVLWMHDIQ